MSYLISLSTEAEHRLSGFPETVRSFCISQLHSLAENPTLLSQPSRFPYKLKCQLFRMGCTVLGQRWEFFALFQYGQDEKTIFIADIRFSSLPPELESDGDFPNI